MAAREFRDGTRWGAGAFGRVIGIRLAPGEDLKHSLEAIAESENVHSAAIIGGAASLRRVILRNVKTFPESWPITDRNRMWTTIDGPLEMVSIMGNISRLPDGRPYVHAHVVVSTHEPAAACYGGHLVDGAEILTTGELIIAELAGLGLRRDTDPATLGDELFFDSGSAEGRR
jgi:hypothetical protein